MANETTDHGRPKQIYFHEEEIKLIEDAMAIEKEATPGRRGRFAGFVREAALRKAHDILAAASDQVDR